MMYSMRLFYLEQAPRNAYVLLAAMFLSNSLQAFCDLQFADWVVGPDVEL